MDYQLTYVNRRLVTRTEEVRVTARSVPEAITAGNAHMERYGFRLKQFKKPVVKPV